jgi:hypothetical protein
VNPVSVSYADSAPTPLQTPLLTQLLTATANISDDDNPGRGGAAPGSLTLILGVVCGLLVLIPLTILLVVLLSRNKGQSTEGSGLEFDTGEPYSYQSSGLDFTMATFEDDFTNPLTAAGAGANYTDVFIVEAQEGVFDQ